MTGRMPEYMSDEMSENMSDRMPDRLPDRMPGGMSGYMPDRMPEYMPEYMSDRMSEYTKYMSKYTSWHVMVGITRSRVILTWSHPTAGHNAEKNVTPRSQEVTNHLKNTVFRDFSTSSRTCIFFPLTLSLLWSSFFFSFLLFSSLTLPTSAFPSIHVVGSLTSKPPLIISERVLRM